MRSFLNDYKAFLVPVHVREASLVEGQRVENERATRREKGFLFLQEAFPLSAALTPWALWNSLSAERKLAYAGMGYDPPLISSGDSGCGRSACYCATVKY